MFSYSCTTPSFLGMKFKAYQSAHFHNMKRKPEFSKSHNNFNSRCVGMLKCCLAAHMIIESRGGDMLLWAEFIHHQ